MRNGNHMFRRIHPFLPIFGPKTPTKTDDFAKPSRIIEVNGKRESSVPQNLLIFGSKTPEKLTILWIIFEIPHFYSNYL